MIVLIHTSKTMRPPATEPIVELSTPMLLPQAKALAGHLADLTTDDIERIMKVSPSLAITTKELVKGWTDAPAKQRAAIDSFLGDIYSGLQVARLTDQDRVYAQQHLRILSGLYGILRPLDGIYPYRYEMGYRATDSRYANLYAYWGRTIVDTLPKNDTIIDLTAVEYGKTVTDYVESARIVTPKFLTISPKTGEPTFVVVHAKIARGAFAHWMITKRVETVEDLPLFAELGYRYDARLSTPSVPVFVCQEFKGIGLSVRLT